jgi:hypothetical protein
LFAYLGGTRISVLAAKAVSSPRQKREGTSCSFADFAIISPVVSAIGLLVLGSTVHGVVEARELVTPNDNRHVADMQAEWC